MVKTGTGTGRHACIACWSASLAAAGCFPAGTAAQRGLRRTIPAGCAGAYAALFAVRRPGAQPRSWRWHSSACMPAFSRTKRGTAR